MKRIQEIDGLRAVAVLSVVFYHAGLDAFLGGFVGVDVFFVISGYLITSIIVKQFDNGTFSILDFYQRRARRIVPPLFFMIIITTLLSTFVLLPETFKRFGASLITLPLFASNIFFWLRVQGVGYFAEGARNFPLLHTWSLSVEEQFYVIFPVLIVFLLSRLERRSYVVAALCLLTIGSFALSLWLVVKDQPAAFYLAPCRAWELLTGSICSFTSFRILGRRSLREVASCFGLGLILLGVFTFKSSMLFPGIRVLAPVAGTAFLIAAVTHGETIVGLLLKTAPAQFFGAISYPLYLWHWPLLILASYL